MSGRENARDGWYLYGLTQIKKAMKEGVFEYQAQITDLFKETFSVLRENFATLDALQRILLWQPLMRHAVRKFYFLINIRSYF